MATVSNEYARKLGKRIRNPACVWLLEPVFPAYLVHDPAGNSRRHLDGGVNDTAARCPVAFVRFHGLEDRHDLPRCLRRDARKVISRFPAWEKQSIPVQEAEPARIRLPEEVT